jgi:hypothetical protein
LVAVVQVELATMVELGLFHPSMESVQISVVAVVVMLPMLLLEHSVQAVVVVILTVQTLQVLLVLAVKDLLVEMQPMVTSQEVAVAVLIQSVEFQLQVELVEMVELQSLFRLLGCLQLVLALADSLQVVAVVAVKMAQELQLAVAV